MSLRILALDLADTTGWARLYANGEIKSGVLSLKLRDDETPGARWQRARKTILELAAGVELITWERIVARSAVWAASTLFGLETQVLEVCHILGADALTVMPATLKKFACGNGRAKKPEILAAARKRWPKVTFATHDEADARFVLEWARQEIAAARSGVA